ncbi:hypothetical protein [Auraticoccus monumenti]|uniref:WD40-like Beta Propeller Repeat n=1 Tax=Auraticoccus monumenti TaxID=675864 RepID=A0A1G7E4W0_9ACTN|nr:hypothetical protein [Auraticoccus monumenti]SDE58754.1 hypothetical protein SAMN04489747_3824 [Auraticoccus monumenti]
MPTGREDVEGDGADHLDHGPPSPPQARRMLLVTVLVLVAALVAVVALTRPDGSAAPEPTPSSPTTPGRPSTRPTPTPGPSGTADRYAPVQDTLGAPVLPGADPGWDLFLEGADEVFRVRLATGELVRTRIRVPAGQGYSSAVVTGPEGLLTYSGPSATAQLVPDDGPATEVALPGVEDPDTYPEVYPGPPGELWIAVRDAAGTIVLTRVDARGRVIEGPRPVPVAGSLWADGRGGLLLTAPGGLWQLEGDRARRLAVGSATAVGARALVVVVCDDELACERQVLDRDTGEVRVLGPADPHDTRYGLTGSTSPDGRWWARWTLGSEGRPRVQVLDLGTGSTVLEHELDADGLLDPLSSMTWTPDGGLLLLLTGDGLAAADPRTGQLTSLDAPTGELYRLSVRS